MSRAETNEKIHLKAVAGASPPAASHPAPAIAAEPAGFFLSLLGPTAASVGRFAVGSLVI